MRKQDRQGVRKASDIEQKYDLSQLKKGATKSEELSKINQSLSQYVSETNVKIEELQGQVEKLVPAYDELGVGLKITERKLCVDSAQDFEGDNTRPVEAAFMQTQIGNIEELLKTI